MTRLLTKKVPYTFNRAGYYYFSRRVPADLVSHYSYPRIVQGLKTRSAQTAKSRAVVAAAKLDEYWSHPRMTDPDLIGRSLLRQGYGSLYHSCGDYMISVDARHGMTEGQMIVEHEREGGATVGYSKCKVIERSHDTQKLLSLVAELLDEFH